MEGSLYGPGQMSRMRARRQYPGERLSWLRRTREAVRRAPRALPGGRHWDLCADRALGTRSVCQRSAARALVPGAHVHRPDPLSRTLIRSAPAVNVYAYENAAGETVEETENRQGKLINRRFYRPALPACAYLDGVGLGTSRYWRDDGEPFFRCFSPMTEVGTAAEPHGVGLKNNLAYYVDGDTERAHDLLLKLNVNQRQEAKQAQQALVRAAKALTQQALNAPLPKAAEQAIAAGKPWQGTLKGATVALAREDWPTGKGYDLKFRVRPAGQTP